MKKYETFIGIDVSKNKLDVCVKHSSNVEASAHETFDNSLKGIKQMMEFVKQRSKIDTTKWFFCFEHTGIYTMPLCCYLSDHKMNYALVPALQIQRSIGIRRGKTDKADSKTIARYACLHAQELRCFDLPEKCLLKLKLLLAHRERLVRAKKMFKIATVETKLFLEESLITEVNKDTRSLVRTLERKIKLFDKQIMSLIKTDERLNQTYQLATSVPGVGLQTVCYLMVFTRCFTTFENARQLACYSGVAPFEYQSGTSIKGRSRVSHLANKKLKTLLSMGALSAVKYDQELKQYYERKLRDGKNPMSVLIAVRNKMISRVFATIKRQTPYVPLMKFAA